MLIKCGLALLAPPQMLSNMRYHTSVIISLFGAAGTLGSSSRKLMKVGARCVLLACWRRHTG